MSACSSIRSPSRSSCSSRRVAKDVSGAGTKRRPAAEATSRRKARRKPSDSREPCQCVPHTEPTRHPSRKGVPPRTSATPWWISYPSTGSPSAEPTGRARVFSRSKRIRTGSSPSPGTEPAFDSTSSSMCSPSTWNPPQIPSTGRPSAARRTSASASPRSRSQARAFTVPRVPGTTTRSASASSSARSTNRTTTPGSAASASTSVKFDISGTAHTATRSTSSPTGGATTDSRTAPRRETRRPSSSSMPRPCWKGSTPYVARPVRPRSISMPGSSRLTSPRNLLTR